MGRKLTDAALKWYTYKKECYSENASINAYEGMCLQRSPESYTDCRLKSTHHRAHETLHAKSCVL